MTKANTFTFFFFTFVITRSHPSLTCPWGLVNVREVLFLAEVVEATTPPVLLLISLSLLDCG